MIGNTTENKDADFKQNSLFGQATTAANQE
jgi:hypothetical protein